MTALRAPWLPTRPVVFNRPPALNPAAFASTVGTSRPDWTPASLPSLALWYTAGPSYCFSDAAGSVPCGDGDLIYTWKDRSGNALHLSQSVSGQRPTLRNRSGVWRAAFDGLASNMKAASGVGGSANATGLSIGCRFDLTNTTAAHVLCDLSASSFLSFSPITDIQQWGWFDGSAWRESGVAAATGVQTGVWLPNAATIRRNGSDLTTSLTYSPGAVPLDGVTLGGTHTGNYFIGDVGAFVACKVNLSVSDVAKLEAYLGVF